MSSFEREFRCKLEDFRSAVIEERDEDYRYSTTVYKIPDTDVLIDELVALVRAQLQLTAEVVRYGKD